MGLEPPRVLNLFNFIRQHYTELQFAATFGGILIFMLIEMVCSRQQRQKATANRYFNNIGLALINFFI